MKTDKIKKALLSAEERFPKSNKIAEELAKEVITKINEYPVEGIKDEGQYLRQGILELLIKRLEECV